MTGGGLVNPEQMAALVAASTILVSILKPYLEQVPGLQPADPLHDATVRLLVFVLNLAGVVVVAIGAGDFTSGDLAFLLAQAIIQAGASIGTYHVVTKNGGALVRRRLGLPTEPPPPAPTPTPTPPPPPRAV